jgi:hypothetical protein
LDAVLSECYAVCLSWTSRCHRACPTHTSAHPSPHHLLIHVNSLRRPTGFHPS